MFLKKIFICLAILSFLYACKDDDKDMEKPVIDMSSDNAFPQNCVVLYRGESFYFRATFYDNQELGSYNIEIHDNFDHHSHSTDNIECELEADKDPINAYIENQNFQIPEGNKFFEAENEIYIPADVDTGDYHFMVRLTDKAGWQQLKGVSIKIGDRE